MLLTREAILGSDDLKTKKVTVPQWEGDVTLKELTGAQRDEWETMVASRVDQHGNLKTSKNLRAKLVSMSLIDANGDQMFTRKDLDALSGKNAEALDLLVAEIKEFNSLDEELDDEVDAVAGN